MAHQDYSEICPIFNEGVEKEMLIPHVNTSATLSIPIYKIPAGREITILEVLGDSYTSDTCYLASTSCTIGIYKVGGATSASLSNRIGSIAFGSADRSVTCGMQSGSMIASTAASASFTSTDLVGIAMHSFSDVGSALGATMQPTLHIRYKDK